MASVIKGASACVFDAYGTLFNFSSAIDRHKDILGSNAEEIDATWRRKQLEYTWLRSMMHQYAPFWTITGEALDYAFEAAKFKPETGTLKELREIILKEYLILDVFSDVIPTLDKLKNEGIKTAILSNGTYDMLNSVVSFTKLGPLIDHIISVEEVGIYKPDPSVYHVAVTKLGLESPKQVCFLSANAFDAVGAANVGFQSVWINRKTSPEEQLPPKITAQIPSLQDLGKLLYS